MPLEAEGESSLAAPEQGTDEGRPGEPHPPPKPECVEDGEGDGGEDQATAATGASMDHSSAGTGDVPSAGQAGPTQVGSMTPRL